VVVLEWSPGEGGEHWLCSVNRELLAKGQVLQSDFPNPAGQNKKANQQTK
jgi:hypothetical protein